MNELNVKNCTDYLVSMDFENIQFKGEQNKCLYFSAIDEDYKRKNIEFDPLFNKEGIVVSVEGKHGGWIILDVLKD
ncbi:hypothetical protein [Bacillus xiapuensis]|uniref:Uncharacterized protein n=1 Tax=Bacillus xiapuensis TaxID=2014075 RepID=A0ABU6N7U0_9BACI|nr:hypothetical protein [Bacillus xiapuensis]